MKSAVCVAIVFGAVFYDTLCDREYLFYDLWQITHGNGLLFLPYRYPGEEEEAYPLPAFIPGDAWYGQEVTNVLPAYSGIAGSFYEERRSMEETVMEQKKEKYKVSDGIREFFGLIRYVSKKSKAVFLIGVPFILTSVLVGGIQVYLPKAVLAALETGKSVGYLAMVLLILAALLLSSLLVNTKLTVMIEKWNILLRHEMNMEFARKLLYVDYGDLEKKEFHVCRDRAMAAIEGSWGEGRNIPSVNRFAAVFYEALSFLGSVLLYSAVVGRRSLLLSLMIIATGLGAVLISVQAGKKYQETASLASQAWRKEKYITKRTGDFSMAKDIRLYQMKDWLLSVIAKYAGIRLKYKGKELFHDGVMQLTASMMVVIQNIFVYAYLVSGVIGGSISISDFVLYTGASASLSKALYELSGKLIDLHKISINYGRFHAFLDYGKDMEREALPVRREELTITLSHVSFRFPESGEDLLKDLNLTVKSGEKLAVVGVNGAGKTTLMKLICGLLTPTQGTVSVNGRDMKLLTPEERYCYFSCAFQDISFLPVSIRENISMCPASESDEERIWACLEMAGMKERILQLPDKLDSLMEKDINEGAVDFSGGERQKLILARALYRDSGALILDEPTAALDPISENDIYMRYAAFSEGKTSFFVSHRLSSTRFCDRILLLSGGRIAEEGTHEELLKKGGLYAEMFALQSQYYKEKGESAEGSEAYGEA